jgi:hypothetical protein
MTRLFSIISTKRCQITREMVQLIMEPTVIGYENGRNYRVFEYPVCDALINWLQMTFKKSFNTVVADPFDFSSSEKRFSVKGNKIT